MLTWIIAESSLFWRGSIPHRIWSRHCFKSCFSTFHCITVLFLRQFHVGNNFNAIFVRVLGKRVKPPAPTFIKSSTVLLCSKTLEKQKFSCWPRQLPNAILVSLCPRAHIKAPKGLGRSWFGLLLLSTFSSEWLRSEDGWQNQVPTNAHKLLENGDATESCHLVGMGLPARPAYRAGKASPTRLDWEARNSSARARPIRYWTIFGHVTHKLKSNWPRFLVALPDRWTQTRRHLSTNRHIFTYFSLIFGKISVLKV